MYTVLAPERDALVAHLDKRGIDNMVIYPRLVTQAGAYASLPWRAGPIPVAETLPDRLLSLPMFAELTDEEIERVGAVIASSTGRRDRRHGDAPGRRARRQRARHRSADRRDRGVARRRRATAGAALSDSFWCCMAARRNGSPR